MILFVIIAVNLSYKRLALKTSGSAPTNAVCNGGTDTQKKCSEKLYITSPAPFAARNL